MTRPQLPVKYANPKLKAALNSIPQVKYQILTTQGQDILVGRLKIETPPVCQAHPGSYTCKPPSCQTSTHAFILRRFDTGAISLTTMFRAAFPGATELDERAELSWVKDNFDLSGNNGSNKELHITRLAGTWVDPGLAMDLAEEYALGELVKIMAEAKPDPNTVYRKSGRSIRESQKEKDVVEGVNMGGHVENSTKASPQKRPSMDLAQASMPPKFFPTPSPTGGQDAPPAKRRREKSRSPTPSAPAPITQPSSPAALPVKAAHPRRSTRTKSPTPKITPTLTNINTPSRGRGKRDKEETGNTLAAQTPSDKTLVDEDGEKIEEMTATELHKQDITEQKQLVEELKAARGKVEQTKLLLASAGAQLQEEEQEETSQDEEQAEVTDEPEYHEMEQDEIAATTSKKRARDETEEGYNFDFRAPEVDERQIATNQRIRRFQLEPRTRSLAWGVAAFAFGMGAISLLPNLL